MTEKNSSPIKTRKLNNFIVCVCGILYISGYTHCPKCGVVNPDDNEKQNKRSDSEQSTI